jgi:transposase
MEKIHKQNVGIDVSGKELAVCLMVETVEFKRKIKGTRKFPNNEEGIKSLHRWVEERRDPSVAIRYTMEATGVYHENLAYYLQDQGEIVHIVLPNRAKKYAQSLEYKSKTDKIDSKILARMGLERELQIWTPMSPVFRLLKGLTRERSMLIKHRTMLKNQRHAMMEMAWTNKKSISRVDQLIRQINKQIEAIEDEVEKMVDQEEVLKKKLLKLMTIPGIGFLSAVIIVAETDGFTLIRSRKQLISFAGLDVKIQESGKWKGKPRISKKGNVHIRKALYFPALTAARDARFEGNLYNRIFEKKGIAMIASVALQRKMLALMFTLWKNDTIYVENYQKGKAA